MIASSPAVEGSGPAAPAGAFVDVMNVGMGFEFDGKPHTALQDVSFGLQRGSFTSLIGPSGCGKSTLLRLIADILQPTAGRITIDGLAPGQARLDRRIGFVFQEATLLPWRSIRDNVALPLEVAGRKPVSSAFSPDALLELVGLEGFENARPAQLSGGMQQRVAIARALVLQPDVLLLDEPFGALDEITRQNMNDEMRRIWSATRTTALLVTHSLAEAVYMSEQVIVMHAGPGRVGRLIEIDLPAERTPEHLRSHHFADLVNDVRDGLAGH